MVDDRLRIFIEASDKATAALSSVQRSVMGLVGAYLSFQAASRVFQAAIDQIQEAVAAASAQEQADIRLANAVATLGGNTARMTAHLKEQASALQLTTTFTDDSIQAAQALLVSLGRLSGEGLDRATKAAVALAQGLGVDLESAATLLAKAAQGSTAQLARYGIVLDESLSKTEKFEAVLKFVEGRFGTLAEAMGASFQGRLTQMTHQWGELQETLGKAITNNDVILNLLKEITLALGRLNEQLSSGDIGESVAQITISIVKLTDRVFVAVTAMSALFDLIIHEGNALSKIAGFSTIQERLEGLKELFLSGFQISPLTRDLRELMNAAHDVAVNVETAHNSLRDMKTELAEIQKGGIAPSEIARWTELADAIKRLSPAAQTAVPAIKDVSDQVKILGLGISVSKDKVDDLRLALAKIEEIDVTDPFRPIVEGEEGRATLLAEFEAQIEGINEETLRLREQWNAVGEAIFEATAGKNSKAIQELNDKLVLQHTIMQTLIDTAAEFGSQFVQALAAGELTIKNLLNIIKDLIIQMIAYIVKLLIAYALQKALGQTPFGIAVGFGYGIGAGLSGGGGSGSGGFGPLTVPTTEGLGNIGSSNASVSVQQGFLGVSDSFVRDLTDAQVRIARQYGVSLVPLGSLA